MKYNHSPQAEDSAVEGKDFRLFSSDNCTLEGDYSPGGCVCFSPGQTTAGLLVEILPDTLLEGNEVFHLKIEFVRGGRRSDNLQLSYLQVTIIDAAQREGSD